MIKKKNKTNKLTYAPILLFTYARLHSLKRLVKSLKSNKESYNHELFIFSDAPKNIKDKKQVGKVRDYIKTIKGFKKIIIFNNKKNLGTALNIINGVSKVINKRKKVIILEDDLLLSSHFLDYMNKSLAKYEKLKKVWHISAWNYNFKFKNDQYDAYLSNHPSCWGWATWQDRWVHFKKNPKKLISGWKKEKIKKFNLDNNYNFWSQVLRNNKNIINTWAIFWYATIFEKKGLCLTPKNSLVLNMGNDNFAVNTHKNSIDKKHNFVKSFSIKKFPKVIKENQIMINTIKSNLKTSFFKRIIRKFVSMPNKYLLLK